MATADEILSSLNDLVAGLSATLDAAGDSKLVTLNRATGADAALVKLREGGSERFRWGLPPGEDDFVIQYSPDGSPFSFADRFRIDGATGLVTITGLALDGASFNDTTFTGQSLFDPGSAAAPAIAAAGDVNTGLFFPAADRIAAVVGGAEMWRTSTTGLAVGKTSAFFPLDVEGDVGVNGNINLGRAAIIRSAADFARGNVIISAPNYGTTRQVSYGNNLYIDDAGVYQQDSTIIGGAMLLMSASNGGSGEFVFVSKQDPDAGGTESVRALIDGSGRLVVGGTSGSYLLDVYGDIRARDRLLVGTGGGNFLGDDNLIKPAAGSAYLNIKGGAGRAKIVLANDFVSLIGGNSGGSIRFQMGASTSTAGGTEVGQFNAAGQFLIGTSVAGASLLIVNDDSIQINNSKTPASASDTGATGQIAWDGSYLYVCTATDTWTRAALATW